MVRPLQCKHETLLKKKKEEGVAQKAGKKTEAVSLGLLPSTVTSRLSGCCWQPDMMSYTVELGLGG